MKEKLKKLQIYNALVGIVLVLQGGFMWLVSKDTTLPLTTLYLKVKEAGMASFPAQNLEKIADVKIGPLVAVFLILSGLFLLGSAFIWRKKYEEQIQKGMNLFRWAEYSITSSLMIVVIAMLCGVYDLGSLILLFALNACMILFGWVMETANQGKTKVDWTAYLFGCFAGIVPWIVLGLYFFSAVNSGDEAVPKFVYAIFWSLLVSFNIFGANMVLQYKKVGKWKDYLYGEYVYITLSLVAKALLAWQVWSGTLR